MSEGVSKHQANSCKLLCNLMKRIYETEGDFMEHELCTKYGSFALIQFGLQTNEGGNLE